MDRTGIFFLLIALALVLGAFWFAGFDQTDMAAAQLRTEIALDRAPAIEQAVADVGITLTTKVIASVIVSLVVMLGVFLYQQARIRELKEGGWDRFWKRREPAVPAKRRTARFDIRDVLIQMLMERNRK